MYCATRLHLPALPRISLKMLSGESFVVSACCRYQVHNWSYEYQLQSYHPQNAIQRGSACFKSFNDVNFCEVPHAGRVPGCYTSRNRVNHFEYDVLVVICNAVRQLFRCKGFVEMLLSQPGGANLDVDSVLKTTSLILATNLENEKLGPNIVACSGGHFQVPFHPPVATRRVIRSRTTKQPAFIFPNVSPNQSNYYISLFKPIAKTKKIIACKWEITYSNMNIFVSFLCGNVPIPFIFSSDCIHIVFIRLSTLMWYWHFTLRNRPMSGSQKHVAQLFSIQIWSVWPSHGPVGKIIERAHRKRHDITR